MPVIKIDYRLTVDGKVQPLADDPTREWTRIAEQAVERGIHVRLERRFISSWDDDFYKGLLDPETGKPPDGWIIFRGHMIVSSWAIVADIPARPTIIGALIGGEHNGR